MFGRSCCVKFAKREIGRKVDEVVMGAMVREQRRVAAAKWNTHAQSGETIEDVWGLGKVLPCIPLRGTERSML